MWAAELSGGGGGGIVAADVLDPCVLLQLADGTAALLQADPSSGRLAPFGSQGAAAAAAAEAKALRPVAEQDRITACSLFRDSRGWLQQQAQPPAEESSGAGGGVHCLVARASGACQLYTLPSWQPVFSLADLAGGPPLLGASSSAAELDGEPGLVLEARLACFGPPAGSRTDAAAAKATRAPACAAPLLLALTADHQLLAYKAFRGGGGALRFRRLPLDLPPLLPPAGAQQAGEAAPWRLQRLHCFEGLGEEAPYSGVFVAGRWRCADAALWRSHAIGSCRPGRAMLQAWPSPPLRSRPWPCRRAPALARGVTWHAAAAPALPGSACGRRGRGGRGRVHSLPQRQLPLWLHCRHQ